MEATAEPAPRRVPPKGPAKTRNDVRTVPRLSRKLEAYHLMNTHARNQDLHAPACRATHRQVLAGIEGSGRGGLQRQIDADCYIAKRDGVVMEVRVFRGSPHRREVHDMHHV